MTTKVHPDNAANAGIHQPVFVVQSGAKCLYCGTKCKEGYKGHLWRKVCCNCFCVTENHQGAVVGRVGTMEQKTYGKEFKYDNYKNYDVPTTQQRIEQLMRAMGVNLDYRAFPRDPVGQLGEGPLTNYQDPEEDTRAPYDHGSFRSRCPDSKYAWVPEGVESAEKADEFMDQLPEHLRPTTNPDSEQFWFKRQMEQMPLHDANVLGKDGKPDPEREAFMKQREAAFAQGTVQDVTGESCACCSRPIEDAKLAVKSEKMPGKSWHPACFSCESCGEFITNLAHFSNEGKPYCGRHHAELLKPRCAGCDELIFEQEYTLAGGKSWHIGHFCCFYCDTPMGTEHDEYVTHEKEVVCISCYGTRFAHTCKVCDQKITAGDAQLNYEDMFWHEKCFKCVTCRQQLDASDFIMKDDSSFCHTCYTEKYGEKCFKCDGILSGQHVTAQKKKFHPHCFTCGNCDVSLMGRRFFKAGDDSLFCNDCYNAKFGVMCAHCGEIIPKQGVQCRSKYYHADCFESVKAIVEAEREPTTQTKRQSTSQADHEPKVLDPNDLAL